MKNDRQEWKTVTVQKGESLHEALRKINSAPDLPCGGRGTCGLCSVEVEKFGRVKSCQFRLAGTYRVHVPERTDFEIVQAQPMSVQKAVLAQQPENEPQPERACAPVSENQLTEAPQISPVPRIAIDIGTTTVAWTCCYQDREQSGGFVNPQRQFGADVMSRIRLGAEGHLKEMRQAITDALRESIAPELARLMGKTTTEAFGQEEMEVAIAANTTMLHILNGWDTAGLGKAPFAPKSVALRQQRRGTVSVTELPGISAFVGADIVSGLYAVRAQEQTKPVFFLDLGTNGEMAVGKDGKFLVTSAAAGPAFESSELALSIHASGLLQKLHEMLRTGAMDENGTLSEEYFASGYPVGESLISQDMIRELQMAKAAIRAGIEILLGACKIRPEEIKTLYLAGGMGYYIDPEDAIAVGLIPESFRGKIVPVGNTSLRGAACYLREPENARIQLRKITDTAEEIRLAEHPDFEELYISYMAF
jgi:uncharacterized 2Fe-2S/4Fe-4S cluster protein (DUF4445 family)